MNDLKKKVIILTGGLGLIGKKLTLFFNDQGILDSWNLEESAD